MKDYKDTLNLPNTAFPMKANLAVREPEILKQWAEIKLYETLKARSTGKPRFMLSDGPPYANGAIHLGHAVDKILKDMVIKSKTLSGFYAPFIPGWDCHGLPIELNVEKKVGKAGHKIDAKTFRQKCRAYALEQIDIQREAFIRLGVLGDFENPYRTMDYTYEADVVRALGVIAKNNHLHKGFKPVHWCVECGSALAEAEVEYQDKQSSSIHVVFLSTDPKFETIFGLKEKGIKKSLGVVIWTTTPWTLPANQAVALNPNVEYSLLNLTEKPYAVLVAKERIADFEKQLGVTDLEILGECLGSKLEGFLLQHPFNDRQVPIVLGDHVTLDAGTGCVHTAPAHGLEDYSVGLQYGLVVESLVGADGCYLEKTPIFAGEHVFKANPKIIELLKGSGHLLKQETIEHSYPHCWRHKTPLIFRATQQWFISMDQNQLRAQTLAAIKKIQWIPAWGEARMEGMVADRPDWCISRQRTWGVPLAIFFHKETGELHPRTLELIETVAEKIEETGIDAWYELSIEDLLGHDAKEYEKSSDTVEVWLESGVYHECVPKRRPELGFPADLYLEGSDQYRGWFQSSLLTAIAMRGEAPFRQILTHGFTVDEQGRKMSKSLGNVVAPEKVVNSLGADVLRLWVSATDYRSEITVSETLFKQTSDIYRRIRNTARFLLANLDGFDPEVHQTPSDKLLQLDRYIVERAASIQADIIKAYAEYEFHVVYQKIHYFCAMELGSFYLDVIKDRQYTGMQNGIPRRSAQTALFHIAECLVRWIAPILSFTAEEIWSHLPGNREASVFLTEWYQTLPTLLPSTNAWDSAFWEQVIHVRNEVNKALEEARTKGTIGSGLEAEVDLYCDATLFGLLSQFKDELRFVLITSRATLHESNESGLRITVAGSEHAKCERCWHRRRDVSAHPEYPGICSRCVENIKGPGEIRLYA